MEIITKKSLYDVYEFIKEKYSNNNEDIIFSRQSHHSIISFNNCNALKVEDNYNSPFKNSESYKWLESNIKYKPIWSFLFSNEMNNNFNEFRDAFNFGGGNGEFVFICKLPAGSIKTNFYNWVDIHYLLNDGTEEELQNEIYKIDTNYMLDIKEGERIQVLSKTIHINDVINIIKINNI